jgi:hypothetical protein
MIVLTQYSSNNVVCTPNELQQTTSSLFLFEFQSETSKDLIYCLAYNSSSYNRYSSFCITTVTGSADETNGEIYAPIPGQYTYNIYESPTGSLNSSGLNLCETGIMRINSASIGQTFYTSSKNNYIIYQNGQSSN